MKVKIDKITHIDNSVLVKYSLNDGATIGTVRVPGNGIEKAWIIAAIESDLQLREEVRIRVEDLQQTFEGQEIDIPE